MPSLANLPPRIHLLPPELAHQIAAGEVVERPASVLKELLENALDAGARRIEIESEAGGIGLIRIRDDGCGIHRDDLGLALSSHATSKIRQQEELLCIATLGFRGEALASIKAVSRLRLSSRVAGTEHGWCLHEKVEPQPIAHPLGTTVEVRDLFYNTPARRRFLRGEKTEFIHLRSMVERLALSHFEVGIRMHHNRRPILTLPACTHPSERQNRITQICGRSFTEQSSYYEREADGLRLWGWIGHPNFSRSQTDLQYCYVNNRLVRDKLLQHAARQAYGEQLQPGRHPAYLLYLELPAGQVDVNTHPTKHEVRFREARQIHSFIVRTLAEILTQAENKGTQRFYKTRLPKNAASETKGQPYNFYPLGEPSESYFLPPAKAHIRSPTVDDSTPLPLGQARAIVLGRYILAESKTGLCLVDFFAAQAYLAQAQLQTIYTTEHIVRRPLLFPLTCKVSLQEAEYIEQHASRLLPVGLGIHRLGTETVVLREIPTPIGKLNLEQLLPALLTELVSQQPETLTALRETMVKLVGHFPAPAPPPRLSLQEMNQLLRALEALYQEAPPPQNSPPWRELSIAEIEKWFASDPA
jgi:DNA mismatch repair protein MutL